MSALVKEYAEIAGGEVVAGNWVGCFVQRHKEVTHLAFYGFQEAAHVKADTPETRRAIFALVCHSLS